MSVKTFFLTIFLQERFSRSRLAVPADVAVAASLRRGAVGRRGDRRRAEALPRLATQAPASFALGTLGVRCVVATDAGDTPATTVTRGRDHHNFSLIRPVIRVFHKAGSNWIVANRVPFLRITFVAAQNMIKESGLPKPLRF